ncbi:MAG: hypothetical protein ABI550_04095 [Ignavibacteriaceae bacterium]
MKSIKLIFLFLLLVLFYGFNSPIFAQNGPVLYFCEKYDSDSGEKGISDRFSTGYLTVMVKCDYALGLKDCHIQFDIWNPSTKKFDFYKKFDYKIEADMSYVFFARTKESDLSFDEPGIYRVFLLDENDETVASSLIQIIP